MNGLPHERLQQLRQQLEDTLGDARLSDGEKRALSNDPALLRQFGAAFDKLWQHLETR